MSEVEALQSSRAEPARSRESAPTAVPRPSAKARVTARDVNVYYGDKQALKNVSIDIFKNEVVSFIGPSGCGKSTFLRCINRMNDVIEGCRVTGEIVLDGHDIRAGASLVMPIYAIHRHARRWENPDAFQPERFAPGREDAISRYQYMPFGAGPRICIGMAFAMLEATAILATFLQRVRFARAGREPAPVARVTLIPRGGMPLAVRFRP